MADAAQTGTVFVIDAETCSGHGRCYTLAPESFESDDNGYGVVLGRDERDRSPAELRDIVDSCPEQAISVRTSDE